MKQLNKLAVHKYLFFTALCVLPQMVYADNVANSNELSTTTQNTTVANTAEGSAADWGLTQEEWQHYQQLMQGPDGHWYPQLTPLEVLGLNAETLQEQQRFAQMVAQQEHDKLARELAFNSAVYQAMRALYPNEPVIKPFNLTPFNPVKSITKTPAHMLNLQSGDHLVLFVDPAMGVDFLALPRLLTSMNKNPGVILDIYCVGKADDIAIKQWAKNNVVPLALVQQGRITLNCDNGRLQKLAGNVSLPYVMIVHNGKSQAVNSESLA